MVLFYHSFIVSIKRGIGHINMFAEADYSKGKTASMWLCNKIQDFAERIREGERAKIERFTSKGTPRHLV